MAWLHIVSGDLLLRKDQAGYLSCTLYQYTQAISLLARAYLRRINLIAISRTFDN